MTEDLKRKDKRRVFTEKRRNMENEEEKGRGTIGEMNEGVGK